MTHSIRHVMSTACWVSFLCTISLTLPIMWVYAGIRFVGRRCTYTSLVAPDVWLIVTGGSHLVVLALLLVGCIGTGSSATTETDTMRRLVLAYVYTLSSGLVMAFKFVWLLLGSALTIGTSCPDDTDEDTIYVICIVAVVSESLTLVGACCAWSIVTRAAAGGMTAASDRPMTFVP